MISQDGHLKMLGGYLEFFMDPAIADMYQSLRKELDELIQTKVSENNEVIYYASLCVNFQGFAGVHLQCSLLMPLC